MMEISYRREAKRNYLVAGPTGNEPGYEAGYEARMLAHNEIRGLLRMYITYQDGRPSYCYDITSRQPLSRLLDTRFITRDEICQLLIQIHGALNGMEEYLLDAGGVLMEPEYIYVEPELFQTGLCLVPGVQGDFQDKLSRLLQYILKRINHKDRESVVLAYGLYQESLKENCGMEDLLGLIAAERRKGKDRALFKETPEDSAGMGEFREQVCWEKVEKEEKGTGRGQKEPQGEEAGGGRKKTQGEEAGRGRKETRGKEAGRGRKETQGQETGRGRKERGTMEQHGTLNSELDKSAGGKRFMRQIILWLAAVIFPPLALWLFKGRTAVFDNWFLFAAMDGGLLLALPAFNICRLLIASRAVKGKETESGEEQDPWRILYEDEEEEDGEFGNQPFQIYRNEDENQDENKNLQNKTERNTGECFQTALLSERPAEGEDVRRLSALNGSDEDITISYYPFVIGKHKDLADYVLMKDTVSRFHIRLDEENGHYSVTDLNSTNGTRVRGRLLEANETTQLEPGDQIFMADHGYMFH